MHHFLFWALVIFLPPLLNVIDFIYEHIYTHTYIHIYLSAFHLSWLAFLHWYLGLMFSPFELLQGLWPSWPIQYSRIHAICVSEARWLKQTISAWLTLSSTLLWYPATIMWGSPDHMKRLCVGVWANHPAKVTADSNHQHHSSDKGANKLKMIAAASLQIFRLRPPDTMMQRQVSPAEP